MVIQEYRINLMLPEHANLEESFIANQIISQSEWIQAG
jgi:hypothetical protein